MPFIPVSRLAGLALVLSALSMTGTARAESHVRFHSGPGDWCSLIHSTPEMFGDTFVGLPDLQLDSDGVLADLDVPFPGGSNRTVVANHNSPLPQSRIYTNYSHVNGALDFNSEFGNPDFSETASLDQYVVGFEAAVWDDWASIEVRVPFAAQRQLGNDSFSFGNDSYLGDVSVISKVLLAKSCHSAISTGVAVQLPTGDDISGDEDGTPLRYDNDGIYVSPYLAFLTLPDENWFWQGFAQVDFAVQGDGFTVPLQLQQVPGAPGPSGEFNDQTLLRLNLGVGRWFFRKPHKRFFHAMAGIVELHYTTTLQDADRVVVGDFPGVVVSNRENYQDVLNLAAGLHIELTTNTDLRVGVNVPLRDGTSRFHDASVLAQFSIGL